MIFMLKRKMFPKNMINNIYIYIYLCVYIIINIKVYHKTFPQFKTNYSWFQTFVSIKKKKKTHTHTHTHKT